MKIYSNFTPLLYGIPILLSLIVLFKVQKRRNNAAKAARLGCGSVPYISGNAKSSGRFGLQLVINAIREYLPAQDNHDRLEQSGNVHTALVNGSMGYKYMITRDPENVKSIYTTQSQDFEVGVHRTGNYKALLGKGVFTSIGQYWRHSRQMIQAQFSHQQVTDFTQQERHIQDLFLRLKATGNGWTEKVDLSILLTGFTMDTTTDVLFGQSTGSLSSVSRSSKRLQFNKHLWALGKWIRIRSALGELYWLCSPPQYFHHRRGLYKFVDQSVQLALSHKSNTSNSKIETEGETHEKKKRFVLLEKLVEETQDPVQLRSEALNVFLATQTTTTALITWLFYYLACQPETFRELRSVVLDKFGTFADSKEITASGLKSCAPLQNVVNEGLRISSPVLAVRRVSVRDCTLPRGGGPKGDQPVFLPAGLDVVIAIHSMQRRPDLWGDDAEEFRPDRWEGRKVGYEFTPFGAGPRSCIGRE
ncbi:hypothetical protein MMC20_000389 [Loxospora ochrophaea]|nr:hypothetical protein [Loxospora ochrophaea]